MAAHPKPVLILDAESVLRCEMIPLFGRADIALHRQQDADHAAELFQRFGFGLVIVAYPPRSLSMEELLEAIRGPESLSRATGVLIVADAGDVESARKYLKLGADRIINLGWQDSELKHAAATLLKISGRTRVRVRAQLEMVYDDGTEKAICETVDVSTSGVLLRSCPRHSPGSHFAFQLFLPDETDAIRGHGEVVRHATGPSEPPGGFAARIHSIESGDQQRLESFIQRQIEESR